MRQSQEPRTGRHGKPLQDASPRELAVGPNRRGGSAAGGQRGSAPREEGGRWVREPDRTAAFPSCEAAGAEVASRGAGSCSRPPSAGGRRPGSAGPGGAARAREVTRSHARLPFRLRRVLPPPGLRGAGSERVPAALGWLAAAARPRLIPPEPRSHPLGARRRRGGWDWARGEAGRDLEKPPRLHCSGRGRPEEPVPPSRLPAGLSGRAVPRCSALPGPGGAAREGCAPLGSLAGRTPVRATQLGGPTPRRAARVAGKVVRKLGKSCPAPPRRPWGSDYPFGKGVGRN